jgi:hypothetical protein
MNYLDCGYSKPTAKSMIIIQDIIEHAEGHPGKSLIPWNVRINSEIAKQLQENIYICNATTLHRVANKYLSLKSKAVIATA